MNVNVCLFVAQKSHLFSIQSQLIYSNNRVLPNPCHLDHCTTQNKEREREGDQQKTRSGRR